MNSSLQDDIVNSESECEKKNNMPIYYRIVNDVSQQVSTFLKQIVIGIMCVLENIMKQDELYVDNILILKSQSSCIYI